MKSSAARLVLGLIAIVSMLFVYGATAQAAPPLGAAAAGSGGSLTVLAVGTTSEWPGLLPATDTQDAADYDYMNAIYGQLFEQGPKGTIIPDLATGYSFSPNKLTVTIDLRHGVKFQDGTPFNAQAVQANITSDLLPANGCICDFDWGTVKSVTTSGPYTVQLHMIKPFPPIIQAFIGEAPNWTPSPSALAKARTAAFAQNPVGAGPFKVVSNTASAQLTLKANPGYWQAGYPRLASLKFISAGNDQSAYAALQAGTAQMAEGITTVSIIRQAASGFQVSTIPGTGVSAITMNTKLAPFDNLQAREAIYYATDEAAILKELDFDYGTLTQSPSGPGGLFYTAKVPGYRTYDLAKAQALVKQLGGLSLTLLLSNTPTIETLGTALQQEWQQAGIKVTLDPEAFTTVVGDYLHHTWSITAGEVGGPDPVVGVESLGNSVGCDGSFGGVCDPKLDRFIETLRESTDASVRAQAFAAAAKQISDGAYAVYGVSTPWNVIASKSVTGVSLLSGEDGPIVPWQYVAAK
jgi:peptide/nickel transport system substrate-binding protein